MDYRETINFLFTSLPMYQRIGPAAIKKDLVNIRQLCSLLGNPQENFPSIHVAGTNGKGSTSHMLASIFQSAGKKTGLYTSPHYVDFRERIKVDGRMISESDVIEFVESYKENWAHIQPSFFEITFAMALYHFRNERVDIAIVETGLGGRLDSTNIITPLISVITNIGYDHMQMLGSTLPAIAAEKAGIIKPKVPVVIGEWQEETVRVFEEKSELEEARIYYAFRDITVQALPGDGPLSTYKVSSSPSSIPDQIETDLQGPYQQNNIRTVLETCWVWNKHYPDIELSEKAIHSGLKQVRKNTHMVGRWMVLQHAPIVIADAAHNIDGMKAIIPALLDIEAEAKHFVLGFVLEKDIHEILSLFPRTGQYYWCSPDIPRGKPSYETKTVGESIGLQGEAFTDVMSAFKAALEQAGKRDLVFIGGSSYVVGDFLKYSSVAD